MWPVTNAVKNYIKEEYDFLGTQFKLRYQLIHRKLEERFVTLETRINHWCDKQEKIANKRRHLDLKKQARQRQEWKALINRNDTHNANVEAYIKNQTALVELLTKRSESLKAAAPGSLAAAAASTHPPGACL